MNPRRHSYSRALVVSVVAASMLLWAVPARAATATTVTISGASRSGSVLTVTGSATFADQPFVQLGTDPAGDQTLPGTDNLGKDITEFSMRATAGGSLTLRWQLSKLTPGDDRGVWVAYGKGFCVEPSEEPNCWMIMFYDLFGAANSYIYGFKCPDESCTIGIENATKLWETDVYDGVAKTASATVPLSDIEAAPGSILRPATIGSAKDLGSVFSTEPYWFETGHLYPDKTTIDASYTVPTKDVNLAIGAPGQQPDTVTYTSSAVVAEDVSYSGDLDVGSLAPGNYTVYAHACFGPNNCAYATRDVTI